MVREIARGIYEIKIRLLGSPLKNLNSYVISAGDRNLLVDTGFNQPTCLEDLRGGIDELGLDMEKTDLFLTHFHADHCGLMSKIITPKSRVYMSRTDLALFPNSSGEHAAFWQELERTYALEGFPEDAMPSVLMNNPAKELLDRKPIDIIPLEDGEELRVGDRTWRCVLTPGHTPGHMCLYEEATKAMILGDHVLFDITPNITVWSMLPNALLRYIESLDKVENMDVRLPLPGHRDVSDKTFKQRISELKEHHSRRLDEVVGIVSAQPGLAGHDVAALMSWSIRAKNWQEFPPVQKWFAVGEALAHLDYLVEEGRIIRREQPNACRAYYVK